MADTAVGRVSQTCRIDKRLKCAPCLRRGASSIRRCLLHFSARLPCSGLRAATTAGNLSHTSKSSITFHHGGVPVSRQPIEHQALPAIDLKHPSQPFCRVVKQPYPQADPGLQAPPRLATCYEANLSSSPDGCPWPRSKVQHCLGLEVWQLKAQLVEDAVQDSIGAWHARSDVGCRDVRQVVGGQGAGRWACSMWHPMSLGAGQPQMSRQQRCRPLGSAEARCWKGASVISICPAPCLMVLLQVLHP